MKSLFILLLLTFSCSVFAQTIYVKIPHKKLMSNNENVDSKKEGEKKVEKNNLRMPASKKIVAIDNQEETVVRFNIMKK